MKRTSNNKDKITKTEDFPWRGWKIAKSSIEREKEAIKKQFNKESDSQRSWAINTMDFSKSQRRLDKKHSN